MLRVVGGGIAMVIGSIGGVVVVPGRDYGGRCGRCVALQRWQTWGCIGRIGGRGG